MKQDDRCKDIDFQVADNNSELRELLRNSSADAVLYDYHRAYSLLEPGMFVQYLEHDIQVEPDQYGITFAKISTRLHAKVNKIIAKHKDDLRRQLTERVQNQYEKIQEENDVAEHTKLVSTQE